MFTLPRLPVRTIRILDRHIFHAVASATAIALLVLLLLESFLSLLVALEEMSKGAYGFHTAIRLLLLRQPQFLYELFPMALLVGGLLGMGGLARDSELIVMRTAGWSLVRLTGAAIAAGLLLSTIVLGIGEFIAPRCVQHARELQAVTQNKAQKTPAVRGGRGFWARDGNDMVHVQAVSRGTQLSGIRIFTIHPEDARLEAFTTAESAHYAHGLWKLVGVRRSTWQGDTVQTQSLDTLTLQSAISPRILEVLATDPDELSVRKLWMYINYLQNNQLDTQPHWLALWRRLFAPFTHIAMLVVAMPFVFGPHRSGGTGQRILVGVLLGLLFFLSNYLLGNIVLLYGVPPIIGAGLPTLLFMGAGLFALHRLR